MRVICPISSSFNRLFLLPSHRLIHRQAQRLPKGIRAIPPLPPCGSVEACRIFSRKCRRYAVRLVFRYDADPLSKLRLKKVFAASWVRRIQLEPDVRRLLCNFPADPPLLHDLGLKMQPRRRAQHLQKAINITFPDAAIPLGKPAATAVDDRPHVPGIPDIFQKQDFFRAVCKILLRSYLNILQTAAMPYCGDLVSGNHHRYSRSQKNGGCNFRMR